MDAGVDSNGNDGIADSGTAIDRGERDAGGPDRDAQTGESRQDRRRRSRRIARRRRHRAWLELPVLLVVAVVLALGIKSFFVQAFSIPSGSMENTLKVGDRVLVDKFTPWFGARPERGDVVVFHDPGGWLEGPPAKPDTSLLGDLRTAMSWIGLMPSQNEKDLIKRVIAVGGDTVSCRAGNPVEVNGTPLDEPYLYPGASPCNDYPVGTVTVPKGYLWVMGDHRNNSWDSRYHQLQKDGGGFVPEKNVIGRAFAVAWPIGRWSTLPVPATFSRIGPPPHRN